MTASLADANLYVDDLNKLKIIDPSLFQTTSEFKGECEGFLSKTEEFQNLSKTVMELFESIGQKVESMKIKAIGTRNKLKLVSKEKMEQQELLEARVFEAQVECERLKIQLSSLQKEETEQREFIQNFLMHR